MMHLLTLNHYVCLYSVAQKDSPAQERTVTPNRTSPEKRAPISGDSTFRGGKSDALETASESSFRPHPLNLAMSRPSSRTGASPKTPVLAVRSFERPEPAQIISKHAGTVLEDGLDAEKVGAWSEQIDRA